MLSSGVVESYTTIDTASNEEIAGRGVGNFLEGLVELAELVSYASTLNVENAHHS